MYDIEISEKKIHSFNGKISRFLRKQFGSIMSRDCFSVYVLQNVTKYLRVNHHVWWDRTRKVATFAAVQRKSKISQQVFTHNAL